MSQKKKLNDLQNQAPSKARKPKNEEFIGIVEKRLGGSRMMIRGMSGQETMARVPGRMKKFLWIREGDVVLLQPWEIEKDKSDLIYKYKPNEIRQLQKEGLLDVFDNVEEF
ncbi:MAG: translation initiation factor eIF-1A [Candidatus Woesearchaeota archaeon]